MAEFQQTPLYLWLGGHGLQGARGGRTDAGISVAGHLEQHRLYLWRGGYGLEGLPSLVKAATGSMPAAGRSTAPGECFGPQCAIRVLQ